MFTPPHFPLLALIVTLMGAGLACAPGGDAPPDHPALDALHARSLEPHFGLDFWLAELSRDSDLWRSALELCRGRPAATHPNCATVHVVAEAARVPDLPVLLRAEPAGAGGAGEEVEP